MPMCTGGIGAEEEKAELWVWVRACGLLWGGSGSGSMEVVQEGAEDEAVVEVESVDSLEARCECPNS